MKYNYDKDFFENINNEEKAYWAGFIAADGNIRKDYGKMRINLNIRDYSHLEKFRISIGGNMPIVESIRPKNHSCYIDVNSKKFCTDLSVLGITPNKSLTLKINFEMIPQNLMHHFLRGYFDGDGSLCHTIQDNKIRWQISFIGTRDFLIYIQNFLNKNHQLSSCGQNYRFNFSRFEDVRDILIILYNDATIYLERKYQKYKEFIALNDYQVASI